MMASLNRIWQSNTISLKSKLKLYKSLATAILLYGCETWILLSDSKKRIQAYETKCLRKFLRICYLEHKINDWVSSKIDFRERLQEPFLTTVKRRQLAWFRHVTCYNSLFKTSFMALWNVGGAVVGRENAGWTTTKSGHPCPCWSCSQGPTAIKTGRGSLC